ncbi:MAG: hypothetical protein L6Q81_16580 [Bacteroidia bacterium]|nr:hypothetical protein [Bacteroidia bacterium]
MKARLFEGLTFEGFAGAYSLTGTGVFLSAQGVVQIQEILASDLPLSEKIARISQILFFLGAGMWLFAKAAKALQNKLINRNLINELKSSGIKFSESDLRMICKDADGKIVFLESGNSNAGLQHIIERHWNPKELMKYFKNQDEMIQKIHSTVQNDQYISKQTVTRNGRTGLEYTYGINVDGGVKTFKLAVGSNGYVVTFYPQ